jgi:hypothetical protein
MLVLVLALALSCTVVVVIARASAGPDRLAALGFGVCDGEPCFRGIKPGMSWEETRHRLPDAIESREFRVHLELSVNKDGIDSVGIWPSEDAKTVAAIIPTAKDYMPFTPGDVMLRYGPPCSVYIFYADSIPGVMRLIYPNIDIAVHIRIGDYFNPQQPPEFRLQVGSPVWEILIVKESSFGTCDTPISEGYGPEFGLWHGFTSPYVYGTRTRRLFPPTPVP